MRYYEVSIDSADGSGNLAKFTTLTATGTNNGQALQLELDIFQTFFATPAQNGYLKFMGVDYATISQSANFNNQTISISVGMSKGLPLATPAQAGLIIKGTILQSFGNWQGNQISLDLVVVPLVTDVTAKPNLSGTWKKDVTLEAFTREVLAVAFPTSKVIGSFSNNLIYTEDQPFYYTNLEQFGKFVKGKSLEINKTSGYLGANITSIPYGFALTDGLATSGNQINSVSTPTQISYFDIIGNLTWINIATIQAKVVMRADLNVSEFIQFPAGSPVLSTANSNTQNRNSISFQGVFQITQLRHVGNSRQADANSWCTIITAVIPPATQ